MKKNNVSVNINVTLGLNDVVRVSGTEAAAELFDRVVQSAENVVVTIDGAKSLKTAARKKTTAKKK